MTDFRRFWSVGSAIVLLLLSAWSLSSHAHELRPSVVDIMVTPDSIDFAMRVNLEALLSEIGAEHENTDDSPRSAEYDRLRELLPADLQKELGQYLPRLLSQIELSSDGGARMPLSFLSVNIPEVNDTRVARDSFLVLQTERFADTQTLYWQWAEHYGAVILRANGVEATGSPGNSMIDEDASDSEDPLDLSMSPVAEDVAVQYIAPGATSDPIRISDSSASTRSSSFIDYVRIGFEHIIPKGMDHILFVIGLFLLAPQFKPIAAQVTMFTLAHTLTLALGITGALQLTTQLVEPLIALSITVVCIENLFGDRFRWRRLVIVFAFGLLHGLGFAGVLADIGLPQGQYVSSLVGFNVGVELGQLTVVLICFAVLGWWFRQKAWYRPVISIPGSLIVGAIGFFWFLQRV